MKPKAILALHMGEMFWEFFRFAPHVIWKKVKQHKDAQLIVLTRQDRFDIYGLRANILVPLKIKGDGINLLANCHRLDGFTEMEYNQLITTFKNQYSKRFDIIEMIYPRIDKRNFSNKRLFDQRQLKYHYSPREENVQLVKDYILNDKSLIVLAPRYRKGLKRNWPYWQKLYDFIYDSDLFKRYNFVICGKSPDYVPDEKNRFLDINKIKLSLNSSLIGLTIEIFKHAKLTIGSQSGLPNISLLFGVEVLEWGHQKHLHTVEYNINKTKVTFLEDLKYNLPAEKVLSEILRITRERGL